MRNRNDPVRLKRVVVTGLGALTPIGECVTDFWQSLVKGTSGAGPITKFDTTQFKTRFACELKRFDPLNHFDRKELSRMDPFTQFALVAADEAVRDSGLRFERKDIDLDRVGVIWASGVGGITTVQQEAGRLARTGKPRFSPYLGPKMLADIAAGFIAMRYEARGLNFATSSACAASAHSLIDAFNYIRLGKAAVVISGGSEAAITELGVGAFSAMRALSRQNDTPETASRPFDRDRDGFVIGEGAGALILEELDHAKAREAHIYAEMIGAGMSADACHPTAPHPEGAGAYRAMQEALKDARRPPADVDTINTHATSTPLGDLSEFKALDRLFGTALKHKSIFAPKSMFGHLLGAAGAVEAIVSVLSIEHGVVPPTINTQNLDAAMSSGFNITAQKRERDVGVAMNNNFGMGGHNAAILFQRYEV